MLSSNDAEAILQSLIGQKLARVVRSHGIVEIGFRDTSDQSEAKNHGRHKLSMVFHLSGSFRISAADKIITGCDDLFVSPTDEPVDWGKQNTCVFDGVVRDFGTRYDSEYVRKATMNSFGDVRIELTTLEICIFVIGSTDIESWRFFITDKDSKHLVNENGKFELV